MADGEPVTRRECAAVHAGWNQGQESILAELKDLNGSVAENTKFRVQSKAVYAVIVIGWGLAMAPLTAIAIAVVR